MLNSWGISSEEKFAIWALKWRPNEGEFEDKRLRDGWAGFCAYAYNDDELAALFEFVEGMNVEYDFGKEYFSASYSKGSVAFYIKEITENHRRSILNFPNRFKPRTKAILIPDTAVHNVRHLIEHTNPLYTPHGEDGIFIALNWESLSDDDHTLAM